MGTESHILTRDIIGEHEERMVNLKRYYPFFRLCDHSLSQFRDGRYEDIDMGYVVMAVLRFFIEENSFNDRYVSYEQFTDFVKNLLVRDFDMNACDENMEELIQYIFDKITNEGRPFIFDYFDPIHKQKKNGRIRLIESFYKEGEICHMITPDGAAFYLDTKETKDESKITMQQLLLEKMIRSKNFKGGIDVIRRINGEVMRMMMEQNEIVALLSKNIFEGMKALEVFSEKSMQWFDEEQRLFDTNMELVKKALMQSGEAAYVSPEFEEIYALNRELKQAMDRHAALLSACTNLQVKADAMMLKEKRSRFRYSMDFTDLLHQAVTHDDIRVLESMTAPMFGIKLKKTFQIEKIEDLMTWRPDGSEDKEMVTQGTEAVYIFEDEIEDQRIRHNHMLLLQVLFDLLLVKKTLTLEELQYMYVMKFTENILRNGDYYSFLVHLGQKDFYDLSEILRSTDTFLEEMMAALVRKERTKDYEQLKFSLTYLSEQQIDIEGCGFITNIKFERQGM